MTRAIFILTAEIISRLRTASFKTRESMSSIVRKALDAYLDGLGY